MRIALDLRFVNDHFPGIGRYVFSLASALVSLGTPHEFVFLYTSDVPRHSHKRLGSFAAANTRYDLERLLRASRVQALAAPPPSALLDRLLFPHCYGRHVPISFMHPTISFPTPVSRAPSW